MSLSHTEFERLARLGGAATRLASDAVFKEILTELKNRTIRKWAECQEAEGRETAWHDLQAVGRLENYLSELGQQYRLESKKADEEEKRSVRRVPKS